MYLKIYFKETTLREQRYILYPPFKDPGLHMTLLDILKSIEYEVYY